VTADNRVAPAPLTEAEARAWERLRGNAEYAAQILPALAMAGLAKELLDALDECEPARGAIPPEVRPLTDACHHGTLNSWPCADCETEHQHEPR
jgi:hypothetical protein